MMTISEMKASGMSREEILQEVERKVPAVEIVQELEVDVPEVEASDA